MTPVFITGLPRSRTAWLSALLSRPGAMIDHERQRRFAMVGHYLDSFGGSVAGDSSSLLPLIYDEVRGRWPDARWVYVRRNPAEALEAAVAACSPDLEAYIRRGWPRQVELAERIADHHETFAIEAYMLDDPRGMARLSTFLGIPYDNDRHQLFQGLNVQVQDYAPDDWEWLRDKTPRPARVSALTCEMPVEGELSARLYRESDFDLVARWLDQHGGPMLDSKRLPPLGIVVENGGQPVAALFAHLAVDRPVAFVEDPISRGGASLADTLDSFRFGLGAMKAALISLGYDALIANTSPPIAHILRRWGWNEREGNLVKLETSTAA